MKTLKLKMTLGVCLLFAIFLIGAALVGLAFFEEEILEGTSAQQFTLVSSLAEEIDSKIRAAQQQLTTIAGDIPGDLASRPADAQAFMELHRDNLAFFDNSLSLFSADGTLVAVIPEKPDILGRNFSDRPYFKTTVETQKPHISHPFASRQDGQPIVMFTAPILDAAGRVTAVLGGSLNLLQDNFLGNISRIRVGQGGYLYLATPEKMLISHPETNRILTEPIPKGANLMLDKAAEGFDGSGKTINSRGLPFLVSVKHLATTGWILAANFPQEELEAPILRARAYFWWFMGVALPAAILCIWLFMSLVTAPLTRLTHRVRSLSSEVDDFQPFPATSHDEIGELSTAFNTMATELGEQKRELKQRLDFLGILIEAIPTPVFFKDALGRYLGCNRGFETFVGRGRQDIIGRTLDELLPGELARNLQSMDAPLLRLPPGEKILTEQAHRFPDGSLRHLIISKATFPSQEGTLGGLVGTILDISDRKRMEDSLLDQKRFYESLLQNSAVPTFVIDEGHRVRIWNHACEELTGVRAQEVLGTDRHWSAFYDHQRPCLADLVLDMSPLEGDPLYARIGPSRLIPKGLEGEDWFLNIDGKARYISFSAAPIRGSGEKIIAVIETLHDLTENRRTQEDLRKLSRAIEQSPVSVIITDDQGTIEYVNPKFTEVSGYQETEVIGKNPRILKSGEMPSEAYGQMWTTILSGREWKGEFHNKRKNGELYWESASISGVRDEDGRITHFVAVEEDITSAKLAAEMLRSSEERLRLLLESTDEGIFGVDLQGNCTFCNPAAAGYFGFENVDELYGRDVHALVHPAQESNEPCPLCMALRQGISGHRPRSRFTDIDGEAFPVSYRSNPMLQDGRIIGAVISFTDISEQIQASLSLQEKETRLQFLTQYDALTHLPNRALFTDLLRHAIAKSKRTKRLAALLLLDLDRFQNINDSLGHEFGDLMLVAVGKRLKSLVRAEDTVARFSGDEFALVLEDMEEIAQVISVAQKITQSFTEPLPVRDLNLYTTTSIGISIFPSDGKDSEEMLKAADVALFRAKEAGRNNHQFYKPEMNARSRELLLLEGSLRQALVQDQFILHYQPQISLETGRIIGTEALIRWKHPELGMVPPGDFIPLAEESGLIVPIGAWVLETACKQCRALHEAGYEDLRVAVNISARQFREEGLLQTVKNALDLSGLKPEALELEITESTIMNNVDAAIDTMRRINNMGVILSIDDFGTGYSSLSYLKRFPIHSLKIDRSFVRDITVDPNDAAIATSVIALAHSLGLNVVAEGIETDDQALFLTERLCDIAQGYLFSRPLCEEELNAYLRRQYQGS